MDDDVRKAAADAVVAKFHDLMEQRSEALRNKAEIDRRIRTIDRALFDCRAAGRLFDVDIELPDEVRPGLIVRPTVRTETAWRELASQASAAVFRRTADDAVKATHQAALAFNDAVKVEKRPEPQTLPSVPSTMLPAGAEPSIRELVIFYLKQAGLSGLKAAVLRRKVETFLNRQIHYKTIGMSLYRLSKETPPLARRDGLIWFFVPESETKNPGVAAPGL